MPEITLEPGSPSERLAAQLKAAPASVLDRRAVATLLSITPALVDNAVQPAIGLGLITAMNDMDRGRIYKAGPRLDYWAGPAKAAAPASAAPAPAPAAAGATARGGKRAYLPPLQLSLLTVTKDLPLPASPGRMAKGATKYDAALDMLAADGQAITGVHKAYKAALKKAIQSYMHGRPALAAKSALVVRDVDASTVGVWRVPKGTPGTEAPTPATPKQGRQLKAA